MAWTSSRFNCRTPDRRLAQRASTRAACAACRRLASPTSFVPRLAFSSRLPTSARRSFGMRLRNQKTPVFGWGQGRDIARTTCVPSVCTTGRPRSRCFPWERLKNKAFQADWRRVGPSQFLSFWFNSLKQISYFPTHFLRVGRYVGRFFL